MKNYLYLFVFVSAFFLSSCSSDDDDCIDFVTCEIFEIPSVEGNWNLEELTYEGTASVLIPEFPIPIPVQISGYADDIDAEVVFELQPNSVTSNGTFTNIITITFLGESTTQELPSDLSEFFAGGTWVHEADELIITDENGIEQTAEILILDEERMHLLITQEIEFEKNPVTITMEINLSRQ